MKWNRLLLAAMVAIAIVMGWQLYQTQHADNGQLGVNVDGRTLHLRWQGRVDLPMASSIRRAFERYGATTEVVQLDLHSGGGAIREGGEVIKALETIKTTHKLITHVAAGERCMSMCVPIYMEGDIRRASPKARFMFHEPKRYYDDGKEAKGFSFEQEALTRRFFERYLASSPIDPGWLKQLEQLWIGKDIFKSGQDLVVEQSNIVTELTR